jgi:hypothetical protein
MQYLAARSRSAVRGEATKNDLKRWPESQRQKSVPERKLMAHEEKSKIIFPSVGVSACKWEA